MEKQLPPAAKQEHSCCVGVLYMKQGMHQPDRLPTCLGIKQHKEGDIGYDPSRALAENVTELEYFCLGYSTYQKGGRESHDSSSSRPVLPYCEGLEVAKITEFQALNNTARQSSDATSSNGSGTPFTGKSTPAEQERNGSIDSPEDAGFSARFLARVRKNANTIGSALNGEVPAGFKIPATYLEFQDKFSETAEKNRGRMSNALNLMADNFYTATLKPLLDRLLDHHE